MDRRQRIVRDYLSKTRDDEFVYGSTDCCKWAATLVHAMTGIDYSAGLVYNQACSAETMETLGGFEKYATRCLGAPISVEAANDGDIALCRLPVVGHTFGIITKHNQVCWVRRAPRGLIAIPFSRCEMAWSIPCLR